MRQSPRATMTTAAANTNPPATAHQRTWRYGNIPPSIGKPRKSLLGNILSYVMRKRKVDEDEVVKPPIPAWSQFAFADTSRPYVEDYGDDDIGEGFGL
jgi:hypothetical protein